MTSGKPIIVNIMGIEYPLKADFEPEHVRKIADDLNARMSELSGSLLSRSLEKTAILTALNLEHELFSLEQEKSELVDYIELNIHRLLDKIDKTLSEN